jgi:pilus assembly protein Flp/PilA
MLQIVRTFVGHYARYISNDERGVTAIEYGLIAALIAIVIIGAVSISGEALREVFIKVHQELTPLAS